MNVYKFDRQDPGAYLKPYQDGKFIVIYMVTPDGEEWPCPNLIDVSPRTAALCGGVTLTGAEQAGVALRDRRLRIRIGHTN